MPAPWREELGSDWSRVYQEWLHTLGNLTLTGYNSEYRDHPFSKKREMQGGFRHSPLRLNEGLGHTERWDEVAILARAERLATQAVAIWNAPQLSEETLAAYRTRIETRTGYTIDDHPHLAGGTTRKLFDAFRREIMALDEAVIEEFLKLYVAYKVDTNFTDVVAQAGGLRISINMPFSDLVDPKRLCRDVSKLGRWGNGEVEIRLERGPAMDTFGRRGARSEKPRVAPRKRSHNGQFWLRPPLSIGGRRDQNLRDSCLDRSGKSYPYSSTAGADFFDAPCKCRSGSSIPRCCRELRLSPLVYEGDFK